MLCKGLRMTCDSYRVTWKIAQPPRIHSHTSGGLGSSCCLVSLSLDMFPNLLSGLESMCFRKSVRMHVCG